MSYASRLRRLLVGFQPRLEHLYLLEAFQVEQMLDRLPAPGVATLLRLDPSLRTVLSTRYPELERRVGEAFRTGTLTDGDSGDLLWEIADLLVYNVAPDLFDAVVPAPAAEAILELAPFNGPVADVGAGTGRLALSLARHVPMVYAVEPVSALRTFIREQRDRLGFGNVYVLDGFLHDLPFPDDALGGLVTRSALGWRLHAELAEVDRVLAPGGHAIHLTGLAMREDAEPLHGLLTGRGYRLGSYNEGRTACRAYVKRVE